MAARTGDTQATGLYETAQQSVKRDEERCSTKEFEEFMKNACSAFWEWCEKVEIGDRSLVQWPVQFKDTGRGVAAAHELEAGKQVLSIPRSATITLENAERSLKPLVSEEIFEELMESDTWMLAVFVLHEYFKCETSPWQAISGDDERSQKAHPEILFTQDFLRKTEFSHWFQFLCVLPSLRDLKDFPELWSNEEIQCCMDPALKKYIENTRKETVDQFHKTQRLNSLCFEDRLQWIDFLWATLCVKSRIFLDALEDDDDGLFSGATHMLPVCIVPLADMLNHSKHKENVEAKWEPNSSTGPSHYTIVTTSHLQRGDELCLSYGEEPSFHFVSTYGLMEGDENDQMEYATVAMQTKSKDTASKEYMQEMLQTELYPGHSLIAEDKPQGSLELHVPIFSSFSEFVHQTLPILRFTQSERVKEQSGIEWARSPVDLKYEINCLKSLRRTIERILGSHNGDSIQNCRLITRMYRQKMWHIYERYRCFLVDLISFVESIADKSDDRGFIDFIKSCTIQDYLSSSGSNWVSSQGMEGLENLNGYLKTLFQQR